MAEPLQKNFEIPSHPTNVLKGHKGPVYVVRFNREGEYCMSGSQDRNIILWNPIKGTLIKTYNGPHNNEVLDIAITDDNGRFASVGGDKSAFIWDVTTGKTIRKFQGHTSRINTCCWTSDFAVLATGSYDGTLRFWDCKSSGFHPIEILKNFKDSVSKIIIDNTEIITASIDGFVRTFDIRKGEITKDELSQPITFAALSYDKRCLALSCLDNKIRLLERDSGDVLSDYVGHRADNHTIECKFLWDDSTLLSGSEDGNIYIYNVLKGRFEEKFRHHSRTVCSIDLSPRKNAFISASHDATIVYWATEKNPFKKFE